MSLFHLIDALSASFFALLGIWAAVVRRHWFLRFGVVGAVLLLALLIPAYELVIEFGIEVGLITAGVWLARGRRNWRPRLSLETALLTMVVVAVGAAFATRLPTLGAVTWAEIISVGVITALAGLLCLWVVCSQARLWMRLACGIAGAILIFVLLHFGAAVRNMWQSRLGRPWPTAFAANYRRDDLLYWLNHFGPTIVLAFAVMLVALATARATGWFTSAGAGGESKSSRLTNIARVAFSSMLLAIAAPLFYLLFCLASPPPIPEIELPNPNGYDDFVAAGELIRPLPNSFVRNVWKLPRAGLETHYRRFEPVAQRVALGLKKECRIRNRFDETADSRDVEALLNAAIALTVRQVYLREYGATADYLHAMLMSLRFSHEARRGGGVHELFRGDAPVYYALPPELGKLSGAQCRSLLSELLDIETHREPRADQEAVQAILDQRADWQIHLQHILTGWSGAPHYPLDYWERRELATWRLLLVGVALETFFAENGRPPDSLDDLVPDYLPYIPDDPHGVERLGYRRDGFRFKAYSFGWDGDDDKGVEEDLSSSAGGDTVFSGPAPRPIFKALCESFGEEVTRWLMSRTEGRNQR